MTRLFSGPLGRWLSFFLDALLVSIVWAVCCLPVLTAGAATAALHRVAQNWVRERSGCGLRDFFRAFRENLPRGTAVGLILLVPLLVIGFSLYAVLFTEGNYPNYLRWMTVGGAVIWLSVAVYALPLQATFENTPFRTVGNALRIALARLPTTLILDLIYGTAIFFTVLFLPGAVLFFPIAAFLSARITWNVFSRIYAQSGGTDESS